MDNPTAEIHNHTRRLDKTPHPRHAPLTLALPERAPVTAEHRPARLEIPSIGVDTDIIDLGLDTDGALEVPPDGKDAGVVHRRFPHPVRSDRQSSPATSTGKAPTGSSSICGISKQEPTSSSPREDGSRAVFTATSVEHFPKEDFPTDVVYGRHRPPRTPDHHVRWILRRNRTQLQRQHHRIRRPGLTA